MGWLKRWRDQRRVQRIAQLRRDMKLYSAPTEESPATLTQMLTALNTMALEREKIAASIEIKRIEARAEDARLIREEEREQKAKLKALKELASERTKTWQAKNRAGQRPAILMTHPFMMTCEECLAVIENRKPKHENDMLTHAQQQHAKALEQRRIRLAGGPNAAANQA